MKTLLRTILLLFLPLSLVAQGTIVDLSRDGALDRQVWRHDVDAYRIEDGWLCLSAEPNLSGRKLIAQTVRLDEQVQWEGVVQTTALPTIRNYSYVLLACHAEDREQGVYHYLALSIGGGERESVALVSVELRNHGLARWNTGRDVVLIDMNHKPEALLRGGLHYRVYYDRGTGALRLSLSEYGINDKPIFEGQTRWQELQPGDNSFGVLCVYSSSRYNSVRLRELSVRSGTEPIDVPTEGGEPTPQPVEVQPLILSEVMANPLAGCPEYVELYNPNDSEISLEGYALEVAGSGSARDYPLPRQVVPSRGFVVLTTAPGDLSATYPTVPPETLVTYRLPRLSNAGFRLQLLQAGAVVDAMTYDQTTLPKGLRSKKGVALERSALTPSAPWRVVPQSEGYASPGLPPRAVGGADEKDSSNAEGDASTLEQLLDRAVKEPNLRLVCLVVDFAGRTLLHLEGSGALSPLRSWVSADRLLLPDLSVGESGVLFVYLEERKSRRRVASWSLKFVRR